jgi:hypothetical protein
VSACGIGSFGGRVEDVGEVVDDGEWFPGVCVANLLHRLVSVDSR